MAVGIVEFVLNENAFAPRMRPRRRILRPLAIKLIELTSPSHTVQCKRPRSDDNVDNPRKRHSSGSNHALDIKLDVEDYKPSEVSVKASEKTLQVIIKRQVRTSDGGSDTRTLIKSYQLPKNADSSRARATLSVDLKTLHVLVPLFNAEEHLKDQQIPIEICPDSTSGA